MKIHIKKLNDLAKLPHKMTEHAAGYDLYSANHEDIVIESGKLVMVSTGFAMEIPVGYEAQIRPRSGLAVKHQIGVLNSPGTIDADYRGEVKIILMNFGAEDFVVKTGTRIAQMVINKHESPEYEFVESLSDTDRGDGGFGHTSH